jgi:hypothetical protein
VQAPAPARIVEGGIPTEALVAQVLVAKYADHLPLYRQSQIYARQGIQLDRSTLADWVGRAAWYQVSAKSKLGEAIRYALTRWEGLSRFLDDGRIDLDSNTVERSIRPLALNRKNALFGGSDEGGDNWAVIATFIENCKISGINPHGWLTKTLAKLAAGHPAKAVGELMPWTAVG